MKGVGVQIDFVKHRHNNLPACPRGPKTVLQEAASYRRHTGAVVHRVPNEAAADGRHTGRLSGPAIAEGWRTQKPSLDVTFVNLVGVTAEIFIRREALIDNSDRNTSFIKVPEGHKRPHVQHLEYVVLLGTVSTRRHSGLRFIQIFFWKIRHIGWLEADVQAD